MSDEKVTPDGKTEEVEPKPDDKMVPHRVMQERLSEISDKKNSAQEEARVAREELEAMKASTKQVEESALAEQGKYKDLFDQRTSELETFKTDYEALKTKADAYDSYQVERRKSLTEKLPEAYRDLADNFTDLSKLETYVDLTVGKIKSAPDDSRPSEGRGEFNGYSSPAELAANDREAYAKYRATKSRKTIL